MVIPIAQPADVTYVGHMDPDLITTADAALMLGVSVKSVNRYASTGRLTAVFRAPGLRGASFFERADVARLARERVAS